MEKIKCKTCGALSMVPMEVALEKESDILASAVVDADPRSRFYTCHVCGDNWLSVKEKESSGQCTITFVHQMGMVPVLKRIAHLQTPIILKDTTVDHWSYFLDGQEIDEDIWLEKLSKRRQVLKSICTN